MDRKTMRFTEAHVQIYEKQLAEQVVRKFFQNFACAKSVQKFIEKCVNGISGKD